MTHITIEKEKLQKVFYALTAAKHGNLDNKWTEEVLAICKQALEKPVQEPFGYLSQHTTPGPFEWQFSKTFAGVYPDTAKSIIAVYTAAQPPAPERWQPIKTAPKTSKAILVHCADRKNTFTVTWARDEEFPWIGKWKHFAGDFLTETPTHWMPIPAAPEKGQP